MTIYQVTLLSIKTGTQQALSKISNWAKNAEYTGRLLACWECEIGVLGQVLLLHCYDDAENMFRDRDIVAASAERYGIGDGLANVSTTVYRPFPMFQPLEPGMFGPIFEVRSYLLATGVLSELTERWQKALPRRMELSKPLIVMHSTDGVGPRLMHIWPYASLEERDRIRVQAAEEGIWPVRGAPGTVVSQQSEIFTPAAMSPIR
jgi:NIPSNAP